MTRISRRQLGMGGASLALAGCTAGRNSSNTGGDAGGTNNSTPGAGNNPNADATLTVHTSFVVKNLDPGRVYEGTGNMTVHALYETLTTFEGSDVTKPKGLLADKWEASPDGKTFTFTLNKKAVFSDGAPVTVDDVVFSLNRMKALKASPAVLVKELTFTKKDDSTLVVTSEKVNPDVPTVLTNPACGVVNAKLAQQNGATADAEAASKDSATKWFDTASAGSGPYVLESFDAASQVVLKANPKYWGTKPGFGRVVIRNTDAQNQKLAISNANGPEVALDLSGRLLDGLPGTLSQSALEDTLYMLVMNFDPAASPTTSNPKVRQAIRTAIDYEGIANLFGKGASPAAGLVPPAFSGTLPRSEVKKADPEGAKKLLAEAGVSNPKVKLIYPAMTYRGIDLGTIATKVNNDCGKAGITVELNPNPLPAYLEAQRSGKSEMAFTPQSLNYPVAASLVNNMGPGNSTALRAGWTPERAGAEPVAASRKVEEATTSEARKTAMQEWQRVLNKDSPYISMAFNSAVVVATKAAPNATYSPAGWIMDLASVGRSS